MVTEVGRQPWVIYNLMLTSHANSVNVSTGEVIFTLIGFMALYLVLGLLFLLLVGNIIAQGPDEPGTQNPLGIDIEEKVAA